MEIPEYRFITQTTFGNFNSYKIIRFFSEDECSDLIQINQGLYRIGKQGIIQVNDLPRKIDALLRIDKKAVYYSHVSLFDPEQFRLTASSSEVGSYLTPTMVGSIFGEIDLERFAQHFVIYQRRGDDYYFIRQNQRERIYAELLKAKQRYFEKTHRDFFYANTGDFYQGITEKTMEDLILPIYGNQEGLFTYENPIQLKIILDQHSQKYDKPVVYKSGDWMYIPQSSMYGLEAPLPYIFENATILGTVNPVKLGYDVIHIGFQLMLEIFSNLPDFILKNLSNDALNGMSDVSY